MTVLTTSVPAVADTREAWLLRAAHALREIFEEVGEEVPALRVSVGFPGGRGSKASVIGQCWSQSSSQDGVAQVFISPVLIEPVQILATLAHEIVHAIDDCQSGHRGRFAKIAKGIGLEGPMTATHAGEALAERLAEIVATLGDFPHAQMLTAAEGGPKKQSTRMIKVECSSGNGYKVRMTRQWLDEYGAPSCPCHGEPMEEA